MGARKSIGVTARKAVRAPSADGWRGLARPRAALATLAAATLAALVWIGMFPALPRATGFVPFATPLPAVVASAQALVIGIVIGVALWRQPANLRPLQALIAAVVGAGMGWALDASVVSWSAVAVCAASAGIAVLVATRVSRRLGWVLGILVLVLVLSLFGVYTGAVPGPMHAFETQQVRPYWDLPPQVNAYAFDTFVFMRTSQLMRQGMGYYPAFLLALKADTRRLPFSSPFNFRPPLVVTLWSVLPMRSVGDLLAYSVALGAVCATLAFMVAAEFVEPGIAAVAAVLVCRLYGTLALYPQPIIGLTEFWVAPLALLGLWFTLRRWWIAGAVVLCIALLGREMMVLLLPAWYVALYLRAEMPRARKHVHAGIAALGAALALGVPYWMASRVAAGPNTGVSRWLFGGVGRLFEDVTLTHNGAGWAIGFVQTPLFVFAVALVAIAAVPSTWRLATLATAVGVYTVFLTSISGGDTSFYWGVPYLIVLMTFAPLIAARFAPSAGLAADSPQGAENS